MQTIDIPMEELHRQLKKLEEIQTFLQRIPGLAKKKEVETPTAPAPALKIHCYWQENNLEAHS